MRPPRAKVKNYQYRKRGAEMKYVIRRPIGGISLNGFEYVLDGEDGNILFFDSEDQARKFLIEAGYSADELREDLDNRAIDINVWEGEGK